MPSGYELAREQLREIAEASAGTVAIIAATTQPNGCLQFDVSIRFDGLPRAEGGLPVRAREPFWLVVPTDVPLRAPEGRDTALTKVQIRPPKGVIGAGMGLGHRRLQAEPGFEQPTGGA